MTMCLGQLSQRPAYRWIILAAGCMSMFINFGYLCGAVSIMTITYQDMYSERVISSTIAPVQVGISMMSAFPNYYLARRFGDRWVALLGAVLTCSGYVLTGYTTESWQGVLTAGILTGWGAGIATTTSYRVIPLYFKGKQFLPFAIISGFNLLASIIIPRSVMTLSDVFEFKDMFLLLGITFLILNVMVAATYEPKQEVENKTSQDIQSTEELFKFDIRIPRQDSAMFKLPRIDTSNVIAEEDENGAPSEKSEEANAISDLKQESKPRAPLLKRQSSAQIVLSDVYPAQKSNQNDNGRSPTTMVRGVADSDADDVTMKFRAAVGADIISMFSKNTLNSLQMKYFIHEPKVILHLVQVYFYGAGFIMYNSLSGDYARHVLRLTDEQIADALTALAGAGISGTLVYVAIAKCIKFSPTVLHTVLMTSASVLFLSMTFTRSYEAYLAINIIFGAIKSLKFANLVNIVVEISPNTILAVNLQSIASILQGFGCITGPYIAGFIIQSVNEFAGMYAAAAFTLTSAIVFIPVALKYMWRPRQLDSPISCEEDVQQVKSNMDEK